jgi:hypothetical protein
LRTGEVLDVGRVEFGAGQLVVRVIGAPPGATATVTVMSSDREVLRATADRDGRASFELPVGCHGARAEALGLTTAGWSCAWVRATDSEELVLSLGEPAVLAGTVMGPAGPLRDVALYAQRSRPASNTRSAATTDAAGSFALQGLEPGRYWFGIERALMGQVELAGGERRELSLELGWPETRVEVQHEGARATWLKGLSVASSTPSVWRRGRASELGAFADPFPEGAHVVELDPGALDRSATVLVPGPPASGADYVLALPSTGIEVRLIGAAAHRPDPRATLESLAGAPAQSSWTTAPRLLVEAVAGPRTDGARSVRIPYLAPGSVVALRGLGSDGRERTERVTVGAEGWTRVVWQ